MGTCMLQRQFASCDMLVLAENCTCCYEPGATFCPRKSAGMNSCVKMLRQIHLRPQCHIACTAVANCPR